MPSRLSSSRSKKDYEDLFEAKALRLPRAADLATAGHVDKVFHKPLDNPHVLAAETGLTYSVCYKLWHERTDLISFTTLAKLCDGLKVSPGELFEYKKKK